MARNTWSVEKWNGLAWVADTAIYRPNSNLDIDYTSTQQKMRLCDGSNAFITPETLYVKEDIIMEFLEIDPTDSFYTLMINHIVNQDYLRITDHLGNTYTGKFVAIKRVWISGVDDTFDFQCMFQIMA